MRLAARIAGAPLAARAAGASFSAHVAGGALAFQSTGTSQPLQLVRSYQIPNGDPSVARLANLSWTYDSAVSAIAFLELGARTQAEQLLDQLAALQRVDGSIDFAFNTQTGASIPLFRSGTVAWVGLAATDYREKTCSAQYDSVALGAARWLLAQQLTDPSSSSYGLLRGGPDAQWVSTQHNLIARAFFRQLANTITATGTRCRGGLTGLSTSDANAFAATLRSVVSAMDAGIDHSLFVRVSSSGAYFRQGVGDDVEPLDAQALGILYLNGVARTGDAAAVRNFTNSAMALTGGIALSSNPASYNQTYSAAGPFTGYRPYGNPTAPDVLWMEGTLEMRLAMARSGVSTSALDPSLTAWYRLTGSAGPLQANAVVTGNPFNEYHVWPAASAAAWALLNLTNFGSLLQ